MTTYNNLIIKTKIYLNKKLYEENLINYEVFEIIQDKLIERLDK